MSQTATRTWHYKVDLTITLPGHRVVEGTHDATFNTLMSLGVTPPRHIAG